MKIRIESGAVYDDDSEQGELYGVVKIPKSVVLDPATERDKVIDHALTNLRDDLAKAWAKGLENPDVLVGKKPWW